MAATAFVLAAGFGTRLRPLTAHRPKPLVPICGVPALAYSLALCAQHGFRDVIVNAHHLGDQLDAWAGEHEGCQVRIRQEQPDILGTGGGLKAVEHELAERFVVLNADVLHVIDLSALMAAVPDGGAAMSLRAYLDDARPYGVVAADASGTVVQLTSLATADAEGWVRDDTHFTGIHAMDRSVLQHVPEGFACIVRTAYAQLVPQRRVRGVRTASLWRDAGDPAALLKANLDVLRGALSLAIDPFHRAAWGAQCGPFGAIPEGVEIVGNCWVGPGADVGPGTRLENCVIGAGARVPAGADLREVVAWDGTTTPTMLRRAIVHDGGVWEQT